MEAKIKQNPLIGCKKLIGGLLSFWGRGYMMVPDFGEKEQKAYKDFMIEDDKECWQAKEKEGGIDEIREMSISFHADYEYDENNKLQGH